MIPAGAETSAATKTTVGGLSLSHTTATRDAGDSVADRAQRLLDVGSVRQRHFHDSDARRATKLVGGAVVAAAAVRPTCERRGTVGWTRLPVAGGTS